jgi:hypothetical protein
MAQPDKKDAGLFNAELAQASASPKEIWTAPSVTIVDLSESTLAMGPGNADSGILS